ncbi:MAG: CehA/McbA family metallohydrolase, partial [Armatimonadetes bacterium]|nr:CehA/McbA family metallohydrolase [Armatimonadota bacterium]
TLETALSHWADACHAQGGTVIIPHFPNPNCEPAVLVTTGRADALEMAACGLYQHREYYRYLNCGYRVPLVGGTDKMTSDVPVGIYRTYAYVPEDEEFNYENWCRAVRAGRTIVSGGPILRFAVNGAGIGDTLPLPAGGGTVEVEATAESIFPIHTLQIVQQGRVVAATEEAKGARRLHLKASLKVDRHTWLAARCGGPNYTAVPHHDGWRRGVFAHTSPIYIAVGGEWWLFDRDTAQYMLTLIEGGLAYIRHTAPQHTPSAVTPHHGEEDHLAYLERPYQEAIAAIHRRMHQLGVEH